MYQMVAKQLINSRERYVKSNRYNKIPNHGILVGNLVLVKDHTAKSFAPKYKKDFWVVQLYGMNALQVSDKRGRLHNVHITDVRKINMTEKVATQLKEIYYKGRTAKKLIPQGLIPDLGWNTDQQGPNRQPLPTEKQPEASATQITPTQVEGPPSSRLRSKTSKNNLPYEQDQQDPQFLDATQIALETFKDEISLLTQEIRKKAYKNYVKAYREALVPVWNLAHFADIRTILETVTDKNMNKITTMAERLKPTSPHPKAISDKAVILDLETITTAMLQKFPREKLPGSSICEKIGNVFSLLSITHTAYSEVVHGLAELATLLTPQQYTLLLTATITPSIQLIIPGQMISPLSTPPPPKQESSTAAGCVEIMNFTKCKVLPNPDSESLTDCDDNSATRVLVAAIYCQLEKNYFDETHS